MGFEVVKPKMKLRPESTNVSIYRGDTVSMSRGTRERYFPDVQFVRVLYDSETAGVAIKPLGEDSAEAFRLRVDRSKRGVVSLRALAAQFRVELPEHQRFGAKWDDDNQWLQFNLHEGTSIER
jgi:hypothetical protein